MMTYFMTRLLFYIAVSDMPHVSDRGYSYLVISFMVSLLPRPDLLTVVYLSNAIPLRPALAHARTFPQFFSKSTHIPPVALSRLATSFQILGNEVSERLRKTCAQRFAPAKTKFPVIA